MKPYKRRGCWRLLTPLYLLRFTIKSPKDRLEDKPRMYVTCEPNAKSVLVIICFTFVSDKEQSFFVVAKEGSASQRDVAFNHEQHGRFAIQVLTGTYSTEGE